MTRCDEALARQRRTKLLMYASDAPGTAAVGGVASNGQEVVTEMAGTAGTLLMPHGTFSHL